MALSWASQDVTEAHHDELAHDRLSETMGYIALTLVYI